MKWKGRQFINMRIFYILLCVVMPIFGGAVSAADFDADAVEVCTYPSQIFAGELATIKARFKNLSSVNNGYDGGGSFDIRIVVTDPGNRTLEYTAGNLTPDGKNSRFGFNEEKTFSFSRAFVDVGKYTIRAEIWDNHAHDLYQTHRFDYEIVSVSVTEAPDTTLPSNPSSFSGSDPINRWTRDNDLYVKWTGASGHRGIVNMCLGKTIMNQSVSVIEQILKNLVL